MKQITMQEAMRAVANGIKVYYESFDGGKGIIEVSTEGNAFFAGAYKYFLKETVKVALFRSPNMHKCKPMAFCDTSIPEGGWIRVSDWVEIEATK